MYSAYSIPEIETRIRHINELTERYPVPLGSVVRATSYSYVNWGIRMDDSNKDWLYEASQNAYSAEWKDTDGHINDLIGESSRDAGLGDVNIDLNQVIGNHAAFYASEILNSQKSLIIADIGSGIGATSSALVTSLGNLNVTIPRLSLKLIDSSEKRNKAASNAITRLAATFKNIEDFQVTTYSMRDIEALRAMPSESVDMMISNAAIHHNSFNFHLSEMNRVLKSGRQFISGDWHNGICETPERIYWLLVLFKYQNDKELEQELLNCVSRGVMPNWGNEVSALKDFRQYFGLSYGKLITAFSGISSPEKEADAAMMKYWLEMGKKFYPKGVQPPISVIQGHERALARIDNLVSSGFCFDKDSTEKYNNLLQKKGKGELAAVMVAKKLKSKN